jgi:hypothetical protein
LTAIRQTGLRNIVVAIGVIALHVVVIRALLDVRSAFESLVKKRNPTVTTWIVLPPLQPANAPQAVPVNSAVGLPMALISGAAGNAGPPSVNLGPLVPPLPSLVLPPAYLDRRILGAVGEYFSCSFVDYDKATEEEKQRCALRLSNLGSIPALTSNYADYVGTPFRLFGAKGTFSITPATLPAFNLHDAIIGCEWVLGVCTTPIRPMFGLDLEDRRRSTVAVRFELARWLSLDIGGQGYMENYLGGARPVVTVGFVLAYRW